MWVWWTHASSYGKCTIKHDDRLYASFLAYIRRVYACITVKEDVMECMSHINDFYSVHCDTASCTGPYTGIHAA